MLERASDEHVSGPAQLARCYVFYAAGFPLRPSLSEGMCCRAFFDDVREARVHSHIEKLQNETGTTARHHRKQQDLLGAAKEYFGGKGGESLQPWTPPQRRASSKLQNTTTGCIKQRWACYSGRYSSGRALRTHGFLAQPQVLS